MLKLSIFKEFENSWSLMMKLEKPVDISSAFDLYLVCCFWLFLAQSTLVLCDVAADGAVITVKLLAGSSKAGWILAGLELVDCIRVEVVQAATAIQQALNLLNQTCRPHASFTRFILQATRTRSVFCEPAHTCQQLHRDRDLQNVVWELVFYIHVPFTSRYDWKNFNEE